ncbi:NDR1/HIN1-like protein 13 [Magnolia sinica]|uniref:NDR1/HIN1-like protein 13 n=1 Tax=Magnolia sinica TaxID=86752 RepID=UPI002659B45D|nr:NDR1/HIN1-like protein 13 [Magnolia sinica]
MSERVHPAADSPPPPGTINSSENSSFLPKPQPPPGTYVIQVPKDQIYRIPPPENARRYKNGRKIRRNRCCCCLCWLLAVVAILLVAVAAAVGIFYLVVRPKSPKYSVESLSVRGFNLTSFQTSLTLSPEFDVTVRAENPNKKIGIYYVDGSSATVSYADVALCNGVLPTFYQGSRNVTVFQTALTGEVIRLSGSLADSLTAQQRKGEIPLGLDLRVPVKIKVGAVKTWKITVKVRCDLTLDKLAEGSKIVSSSCKVKVNL